MSGHMDNFKKLVATEAFEVACDYALLELQSHMAPNTVPGLPTDPYIGIDANAQMFGARRVIEILKNLSDPTESPKQPERPKLHYEPRK